MDDNIKLFGLIKFIFITKCMFNQMFAGLKTVYGCLHRNVYRCTSIFIENNKFKKYYISN